MDVKRAFRCYRGPDDPGPFSDIINSMSFGCRHMKEYNKNGVFCLSAHTPEGYVKVMRVGDVDYIWTESGVTANLYIILIPDLTRGFVIPVTLSKGDYTFSPMQSMTGANAINHSSWDIIRYQFLEDLAGTVGDVPRQQYMPYIFKRLGRSHVSVGATGNALYRDPVNDWNYKYYVLDCTGEEDARERLWYPPTQDAWSAFGTEFWPPWYSMSPFTAHGYHYCFETAIDQSKRIYSPYNTDVTLSGDDITVAGLNELTQDGLRYNLAYPLTTNRFYGKNAYVVDEDGKATSFGENIYISGVVTATIPTNVDPILYLWPWIPYLDEIRAFNILYYAPKFELGEFKGWYMTPTLSTFNKYSIGYHDISGASHNQSLFDDEASFSTFTSSGDTEQSAAPSECGCGDCGTGTWSVTKVYSTSEHTSAGKKHVPIGLIGGKIPIYMKTEWSQTANGPAGNSLNTDVISGTYPYNSLALGADLEDFYINLSENPECGATSYSNTNNRQMASSESASNEMTLSQVLMVGEDVIFSGSSTMTYSMGHSVQEYYNGTIEGVIAPKPCTGAITYTTLSMAFGEEQGLGIDPLCADCDYTWGMNGGGSLSGTSGDTNHYTAPVANVRCADNATIFLYCVKPGFPESTKELIDQITINIYNEDLDTTLAYTENSACSVECVKTYVPTGYVPSNYIGAMPGNRWGMGIYPSSDAALAAQQAYIAIHTHCNQVAYYDPNIVYGARSRYAVCSGDEEGHPFRHFWFLVTNPVWYCEATYSYIQTKYTCSGAILSGPTEIILGTDAGNCPNQTCDDLGDGCEGHEAGIIDNRTEQQKADGCCPAGL